VSAPKGTLHAVAEHLALAAQPVRRAVADLESFKAFLIRLGWEAESLPPAYGNLAPLVAEAVASVKALGDRAGAEEVAAALDKARATYVAVQTLDEAPAGVDTGEFLAEIGGRLIELLLAEYLATAAPRTYTVLELLDVIQRDDRAATPTRPGFLRTRLRYEEIPRVIADPGSIPARVYGWGTADLDFTLIANELLGLLYAMNLPAAVDEVERELGEGFHAPEETERPISVMLRVPVFQVDVGGVPVAAGIGLLELPAESGHVPGVILQPLIPPEVGSELDLGAGWSLRVRAGTDLATTFGIVVRPGQIAVRYPFEPGRELPSAGFGVSLVFSPEAPRLVLGEPAATRLQVGGMTTALELDAEAGELELRASVEVADLLLVLAVGDQDGFLAQLLGGDLTIPLPLAVHWSSRTGLTFSGSRGFAVATYPHRAVGPVRVDEVRLAVRSTLEKGLPPDLSVAAGLGLSGKLGPIGFTIADIGLSLKLVFADGNAGPFDIAVGFKPPEGLGVVVDAGPITGGGFLAFDRDSGRYAGVIQLDLYGISVKAIGLLDTKLPSGQNAFSFLIVISTEFQPIQLGLGFTLNGVGGLAGIHRTVAVDALQAGLRTGTADRILFPEDPIRDASRLVSDLRTVFPPAQGRFVFGPLALIGWGTPTLVEAEIGVVLELPEPIRLVLVGQISTALPTKKAAIVELHLDIAGAIEFAKLQMAIDSSLHDSRVAGFPVTGDMAMRMSWGANPNFALAVGGLNPHFQPPPGFPALRRVTIPLGRRDSPRLSLQGYLALTSNTVQVGALAEVYAEALGFNIYGWIGFDALFVLSPFSFEADLTGGVALRRGASVIAGVTLEATLTGPAPWHAVGKASLSLLFFDVTVPFDATFGEERRVELPSADPRPLLVAAIKDARNWSATLPRDLARVVVFAGRRKEGLIEPAGGLTLRETVVPLNRTLTRFGASAPAGPDRYDLDDDGVSVGGETVDFAPISEYFAAAQFEAMTDAEKLSRPSFEPMTAGVTVAGDAVDHGTARGAELSYETIIVDRRFVSRPGPRYTPSLAVQLAALERAAARAPLTHAGLAKFAPKPGDPAKVVLEEERFVVVSVDDLGVRGDVTAPATKGGAFRALADHLAAHPDERGQLQVAPVDEIELVG
jgi:Family of unknown function (DUF6603)